MGLFLFVLIGLVVGVVFNLLLGSSRPTYKKPTKIELIDSCIPKSLITTEKPDPSYYCINIPVRIHNLHKHPYNGSTRVYFDLIYFSFLKGEFSAGKTIISYDLNELHTIFQTALQTKQSTIYVHFGAMKLTVFPEDSHKIHNFTILKNLYK